jgi:parallel beta-helix repeat protein
MPRYVQLSLLTMLAVAALSAGPAPALATHVQCGDVITQDTTLDSDLVDCPGDGIVIGAHGITLDLNGHALGGTAVGCGVSNGHPEWCAAGTEPAYERVTIRNGSVRGFRVGVGLQTADDNVLARLRIGHAHVRGIWLYDVSGTLVEDNVVSSGIMLEAAGNTLRRNRISGSVGHGIEQWDGERNRIERNVIAHNGGDGIFANGFYEMLVSGNLVAANGGAGLQVGDGVIGTLIEGNRVRDNGGPGIAMIEGVHGNRISDNRVSRNTGDGIQLNSDGTQNFVVGNHVSRNTGDGIRLDTVFDTLARNMVVRNGELGIEAVPEVIDGGGNRAVANGNPLQCLNVFCR